MASSGNFCTLNPRQKMSAGTFSNGNTKYASTGDDGYRSTMAMTHKTYCEVRIDALSNYGGTLGFTSGNGANYYGDVVTFQCNASSGVIYHYKGTSSQSVSIANIGGTVSAGSIVMMAFDPATYKWWVGVNGTWRNSGDPANGTGFVFEGSSTMFEDMSDFFWGGWKGSANGFTGTYNFGQDSTFGGQETAGGNADGNGFGDFKYSVPTGFLANCSGNIVISDDIDPAQTDNDIPQKQFNAITYTGNGSTNAITGLGFKPELVWVKRRNSSGDNRLVDSLRGVGVALRSNVTGADVSESNGVTAFGTDGFTLGSEGGYNASSDTFVAWCWKGGGTPTATNSAGAGATPTAGSVKIDGSNLGSALAGSIPATKISANTKGGFSIITYTGTGSNATIAHGLSAKPDFFTIKNRDGGTGMAWATYHTTQGATKYLELDANDGSYSGSTRFNNTEPTTSTIGIGTISHVNSNGSDYVCYAWHNVEGMQRFGQYIGNNTDNDGPFVYTGFRPRYLVIKGVTEAYPWFAFDSARNSHNLVDKHLRWSGADAEATEPTGARKVDFLSNGFKVMADEASLNGSGDTYVYMCWGDVPFKYNNTF
jgi:hypothetical protein